MDDRLKTDHSANPIKEKAATDSSGQTTLFQIQPRRSIVASQNSDRLLAKELPKTQRRRTAAKPLKHKLVSARTCSGILKSHPKDPGNYLICSKCGQLIGRPLVEAKGFIWPKSQ